MSSLAVVTGASAVNHTATFPFLNLPPEIRNMVYHELLVQQDAIAHGNVRIQPNILATCQQIHSEAKEMIDCSNVFQLKVYGYLREDPHRDDDDNGNQTLPEIRYYELKTAQIRNPRLSYWEFDPDRLEIVVQIKDIGNWKEVWRVREAISYLFQHGDPFLRHRKFVRIELDVPQECNLSEACTVLKKLELLSAAEVELKGIPETYGTTLRDKVMVQEPLDNLQEMYDRLAEYVAVFNRDMYDWNHSLEDARQYMIKDDTENFKKERGNLVLGIQAKCNDYLDELYLGDADERGSA